MQALGFFPSEKEIEDLMLEIKFDQVTDKGEIIDAITIQQLIKCKLFYSQFFPPHFAISVCEPSSGD